MYANNDGGKGQKIKTEKKNLKEQEKVDAVKLDSSGEDVDSTGRKICKITVSYYYHGQFVSQNTYYGTPCWILGEPTCRSWKETTFQIIQDHVIENGTVMPCCERQC